MTKETACGYIRCSTQEQAVHGYGLEVQEKQVRDAAAAHGLRIANIYADAGKSGGEGLDSRVGLAEAMSALEADDGPKVLLIPRLDRLARSMLFQETMVVRLEKANVTVISAAEPDIMGDDPTRILIRRLLGALAEWEAMVIRGRMMGGKAAKIAGGGYGGGKPAFGLQAEDKELTTNRAEAETIARIRHLRGTGASLRAIAAQLDAEGRRPKEGERWHPWAVRRVLARPY